MCVCVCVCVLMKNMTLLWLNGFKQNSAVPHGFQQIILNLQRWLTVLTNEREYIN